MYCFADASLLPTPLPPSRPRGTCTPRHLLACIHFAWSILLQALPDDETMFFERVPIDEAEFSDRPAFTEVPNHIDQSMVMWMVVERGFIVRVRSLSLSLSLPPPLSPSLSLHSAVVFVLYINQSPTDLCPNG